MSSHIRYWPEINMKKYLRIGVETKHKIYDRPEEAFKINFTSEKVQRQQTLLYFSKAQNIY